jgi:hypothetical protein
MMQGDHGGPPKPHDGMDERSNIVTLHKRKTAA